MGGTSHRTRSLRIITRVIVFLLLGAIVNVAVAWIISNRPPSDNFFARDGRFVRRAFLGNDVLDTYVRITFGKFSLAQSWHWPGIDLTRWAEEHEYRAALPRWSRCCHEEPLASLGSTVDRGTSYCEFGAGWPMLTVRCWYLDQLYVGHTKRFGVWVLPRRLYHDAANSPRQIWLPFCPIWPGFAINTVFYAGILWRLFAAPFALRRRRRIRRGLCPACGYPVGDSPVCTECGAGLSGER